MSASRDVTSALNPGRFPRPRVPLPSNWHGSAPTRDRVGAFAHSHRASSWLILCWLTPVIAAIRFWVKAPVRWARMMSASLSDAFAALKPPPGGGIKQTYR